MLNIIPLLLVVAAAIGGLSIVIYIRYKKGRPEEAMVCPLGSDCHSVIYSEYSKFFGIPLELFGMGYYALIALTYITYIVRPDLSSLLSPYVFPLQLERFCFLFTSHSSKASPCVSGARGACLPLHFQHLSSCWRSVQLTSCLSRSTSSGPSQP